MQATIATITCSHEDCRCQIPEGQQYCSPYCESGVGKSLSADECKCGHDACRTRPA